MSEANWYGEVFKAWQTKVWGTKPTADQLAAIHNLGCRPGKQALAIAMTLRDSGVTGSQIVGACGAPQLNKMRGLISDAYLKREPAPMNALGHTVYKCVVTPKGLQRIKRSEANVAKLNQAGAAVEVAKPVKAPKVKVANKPASKPRKPKAPTVNVVPEGQPLISENDVHAAPEVAADQPQA